MVVDDTWQHETARSVDDLVESRIRGAGRLIMGSYPITDLSPRFYNMSDFFILNDQRAIECPALVDKRPPFISVVISAEG